MACFVGWFVLLLLQLLVDGSPYQDILQSDHRPQFHLMPLKNWMNDPIPCYHTASGTYHVFYQYNPYGALWGNMSWAHASSTDLVTWTRHAVALQPSEAYDRLGDFSGSCLLQGGGASSPYAGQPVLFFTGVTHLPIHWTLPYTRGAEVQAFAVSSPSTQLLAWKKSTNNPVIPTPPMGWNATGFRDPYVWWEESDKRWYMLLGSGQRHHGGAVLMYRSDGASLLRWSYLGPLFSRPASSAPSTGWNYELPNLFQLPSAQADSPWVLTFGAEGNQPSLSRSSGNHTGLWAIGAYNHMQAQRGPGAGEPFTATAMGPLDMGVTYAANTLQDAHGRRIMWGFVPEATSDDVLKAQGWANVMSLPRELFVGRSGQQQYVGVRPVKELQTLRLGEESPSVMSLSASRSAYTFSHSGTMFEITANFTWSVTHPPRRVGFVVRRSPGNEEYTVLQYDVLQHELVVERSHSTVVGTPGLSSTAREPERGVFTRWGSWYAPSASGDQQSVVLHAFVDKSVVELFYNEMAVITSRVYPVRKDSTTIQILCTWDQSSQRTVTVSDVHLWPLKSIWAPPSDTGHHRVLSSAAVTVIILLLFLSVVGLGLWWWYRRGTIRYRQTVARLHTGDQYSELGQPAD